MTIAEKMLKDLIEKKKMMQTIHEEMCEIESNFGGMEIKNQGQWMTVNIVDGNTQTVNLFVEDKDGNSTDINISFDDFQKIITS